MPSLLSLKGSKLRGPCLTPLWKFGGYGVVWGFGLKVIKDFFLDIPNLERVCMGCVRREIAGFSGARSGDTMETFGEDELAGWIVFELGLG